MNKPEELKLEASQAGRENALLLSPGFLDLHALRLLIAGGGKEALEKLKAILHHAPKASIRLQAPLFQEEIKKVAGQYGNVVLQEKNFEPGDLDGFQLVVIAVNGEKQRAFLRQEAKQRNQLVSLAGEPQLSDFYFFNEQVHPAGKPAAEEEKGAFQSERKWKRIASGFLFAFFFMILGHILLPFVPFSQLANAARQLPAQLDTTFYWMIAAGFLAQLVDGALGMGYGVTCSTVLLSLGVNLPAISGSIHTAEMFSSGASGYSHYRFGNVNKKLFRILLIPGVIGAVAGAYLLSKFGEAYGSFIRPVLAAYTLLLGVRILLSAFRKKQKNRKIKYAGWLAGAGGFLDSFGGGGWGPLVTSTLIAKGRTPRYVIGSVSITEFFVTLSSALTFFSMLGISHWQIIAGLIIGGVLAAPIAARLAGKLPLKTMFIGVGSMVVIWSLRVIVKAFL